jgi:hydroxymethylpyrimidine kinase/phosphomethylpyrimidine kinase
MEISSDEDVREACRRILALGSRHVLVKGGHAMGAAVDWLYDGREMVSFTAPRVETSNTHGTGCTLSAAIAAHLALGLEVRAAVAASKEYITAAIRNSYPLGRGHGPVNHLFALYPNESE